MTSNGGFAMGVQKQCLSSARLAPAVGPYSPAVRYGNMLYCSGVLALDPETRQLVPGGIQEQTRRVLDNLMVLLTDCGTDAGNVVKTTVFLQDMGQFQEFNGVYAEYFPQDPPARSTVQVARLPLGALVEVEAIALIPED
jgi:2-iminobutanoate/2-iminopropanoate deaminase